MAQDQIEQIADPPTSDPKFDAALRDLEQISSANPSTQDLPPLDMTNEAAKSFMEKLAEWFRALMPPPRQIDTDFWSTVWQTIQYGGVILLIGLVVYLVYLLAKRLRGPAAEAGSETSESPLIGDEKSIAEYEAALKSGDFSRAARIRWVLFLSRKSKPKSQTPYEIFSAPREPQIDKQYEVMFGQRAVSKTEFDETMKYLGSKEQDS